MDGFRTQILPRKETLSSSPPSSSSAVVMLHLISPSLIMTMFVGVFGHGHAEDPRLTERAYVVLEKQDLGRTLLD